MSKNSDLPGSMIDFEQIDSLISAAGIEGTSSILTAFWSSIGELQNALLSALSENNIDEIGSLTHAIKGASLNVGAIHLADLAKLIHEESVAGNLAQAKQIFSQFEDGLAQTRSIFEKRLTS